MACLEHTPDGIPVVTVARRVQRTCGCGRVFWVIGKDWLSSDDTRCPTCATDALHRELHDLDHLALVYRRFRGEEPITP